ncbi:MAG: hypothetical protein K6D37_00795 [Prevotella sp.]|nr:hypothetical protein [Prevotella sp.]
MKIALLQTDNSVWNDPQVNIVRAEKLMGQAGAADLYVLPEMWATGFATESEGIAEDEQLSASPLIALHSICGFQSTPPHGGRPPITLLLM